MYKPGIIMNTMVPWQRMRAARLARKVNIGTEGMALKMDRSIAVKPAERGGGRSGMEPQPGTMVRCNK